MFIHDYMKVNDEGHLMLGDCDTTALAKQYGTPLYLMDENRIRSNMRQYKEAIDKFYGGNGLCLYASKAFSTLYIYQVAQQEGLGVDVVSGGEIYTALRAGFDPSKMYFHGNNKTYEELKLAIDNKIGRIVIDSPEDLDTIQEIAGKSGEKVKVLIRVKPGVDAHTHEFISTGQIDSKFGFAIENGEALAVVKYAMQKSAVQITGLHCHVGSQMFLLEPFTLTAEIMLQFYAHLKKELGLELSELNLGGGFGIKYTAEDTPVNYGEYIEAVSRVIKDICKKENLKLPFILMEPGRSIVGDAGITLYTAGTIKNIENVRKYVAIDGGMGDNPRYILYEALYDGVIANRATEKPTETVTICGKCCESGDIIIKDAYLPKIEHGDFIAIMSTGAYNYSMASDYNRIPRPPVVMVADGKSKLIVKRETYEDLIQNDVL